MASKPEQPEIIQQLHPSADQLEAFAAGSLSEELSADIEVHLSQCDDCCRFLDNPSPPADPLIQRILKWHTGSLRTIPLRTHAGYELLEQLGHGGMATVWKARQVSLNRLVALKQIRTGPQADGQDLQRFRHETDIVSGLGHAQIVQVFDAGEQDGQPYLAMEYLEGGTLANRLASAPLTFADTARLVAVLADAVEYAHQRNVIHRDLKPANILFHRKWKSDTGELPASECEPRIADFGLARFTDRHVTQSGIVAGTPGYMAPEQATGSSAITPSVDIYALGVILYECLTGRPPFSGGSVLETLDLVRQSDPVPPRRLRVSIPRDLEVICLKCLQSEPGQRYLSAARLAEDLRRFLAGRPVLARPSALWERAWKWARRRPAMAVLTSVSAVAMLALLSGAVIHDMQLRRAFQQTEEHRRRADANFREAMDVVGQLLDRMSNEVLEDVPALEETRRQLISDAIATYGRLLDERGNPEDLLSVEQARAYHRLAAAQIALGNFSDADHSARQALKLTDAIFRRTGDDSARYDHSVSHQMAADAARGLRDLSRSEAEVRKAIELLEGLSETTPHTRMAVGNALSKLSLILPAAETERWRTAAWEHLDQLTRDLMALPNAEQDAALIDRCRSHLAIAGHNLGLWLQDKGEAARAEPYHIEALSIWQSLSQKRPRDMTLQTYLAETFAALGYIAAGKQQPDEALKLMSQSVEIRERLLELTPHAPGRQEELASSLHTRGNLLLTQGRMSDAQTDLTRAIQLRENMIQEKTALPSAMPRIAEDLNSLALVLASQQKYREARDAYERAIAILRDLPHDPLIGSHRTSLAVALLNFAPLLFLEGEHQLAMEQHDESIRLLEELYGEFPQLHTIRQHLLNAHGARAQSLVKLGRHTDSVADWDRVVELADDAHRLSYRFMRALSLARSVDHQRAISDLDLLAELNEVGAPDRYNLACGYALVAQTIRENAAAAAPESSDTEIHLAEEAAKKSLACLARVQASGYFSDPAVRAHLDADPDLTVLREREDYQEWLRALDSP